MLSLNNLQSSKKKKTKRVGRGSASSGDYSGKGMKGQKSRSGVSGLKKRGMKSWLMKVPKSRGFTSPHKPKENVNLDDLNNNFLDGNEVTPFILQTKGLVDDYRRGVKILGDGKLKKKLIIKVHGVSASAKEAITKAGGSIELIKKVKPVKPPYKA